MESEGLALMRNDLISIVPTAFRHMGPHKAALSWIRNRVLDLKKIRDNLDAELEMWEALLPKMPKCAECDGYGELAYSTGDPMDGPRWTKCKACDGSGMPPECRRRDVP
jgi:hypothetical protein